jgi:pilus assembly protein CpaF
VGLDRLVREALRMRPDRLVIGECRGAELRELLSALNTGHDGGAGTLHANSLEDVPARLEALAASAGLGPDALARQAVSAFHAIAHVERTPTGRRLGALGRLVLDADGRLGVERIAVERIAVEQTTVERAGGQEADALRDGAERTADRRTGPPRAGRSRTGPGRGGPGAGGSTAPGSGAPA